MDSAAAAVAAIGAALTVFVLELMAAVAHVNALSIAP